MTTDINSHSTSGHDMFTGYPHATKAESQPPSPGDWPSIPAVVGALKPSVRSPLSSIILPEPLYNNPNIPWPGQNGGLMGPTWNPHLLQCDPTGARVELDGTSAVDGVSELRLVEAGVRLIQVNWPREPDSHVVSNPVWDTHQKNAERVRDVLCRQLDRSFATLIEDLHTRGLVGV